MTNPADPEDPEDPEDPAAALERALTAAGAAHAADVAAEERRDALAAAHDAAMRLALSESDPQVLAPLARVVAVHAPAGAENGLPVRPRVFVRLLRCGALTPAHTLAHDDATGVVQAESTGIAWAGRSTHESGLGLPTVVEGARVYAWLPGFRDPRWGVPDEIYDVSRGVRLRARLQWVEAGASVVLGGSGYLSLLPAEPTDRLTLVCEVEGRAELRIPARRIRSTNFTSSRGAELTRLAWAGWSARVEAAALAGEPGPWRVSLELYRGALFRSAVLGADRGPLLAGLTRVSSAPLAL